MSEEPEQTTINFPLTKNIMDRELRVLRSENRTDRDKIIKIRERIDQRQNKIDELVLAQKLLEPEEVT